MSTVLDPIDPIDHPQPAGAPAPPAARIGDVFERFDLLRAVSVKLAALAGVDAPERRPDAPVLDWNTVRRAARTIRRDPHRRTIFLAYLGAVAIFSVIVGGLLVSGVLGDVYESIWQWYPGRPWTHVMRDNPWIYAVLAVSLSVVPFLLAPRGRWGRAFLTYVIFLVGFLGGHVFW
jgi:hypothetical protein